MLYWLLVMKSLEQQARIDDILDVNTKISKETSDRIDSALAINDKINKESLDRDIAIKEVDTKIDLEAKKSNRFDTRFRWESCN